MIRAGILRQLRDMWEVPRDLARGRYPRFVTGGDLPRGQIPVFCFHSLEPISFERKLTHLARNGYVTLSLSEYLDVLGERRPAPERGCVLTFDDGRASVRTVGWPLLRKYGMRGIVFVVPGRVPSRQGPLPGTWDDVVEGRADGQAILARERGTEAFLSWEEIGELADSGLFDVESHTQTHGRIHVEPRVEGFMTPEARLGYAPLDIPLVRDGARDLFAHELPLGTPLLASAPRLSGALRLFEDESWRARCVESVAAASADFFERPGWERELRRLADQQPIRGRRESPSERDRAIHDELARPLEVIRERAGHAARAFCYPWHAVGENARALVRQTGYSAAFWGKVMDVPITPVGGDPFSIARVGEDFVERLPGDGRISLASVLRAKWRRRRPALMAGRLP